MTPDVNGFYKYTIVGPTSVNIVFNNGNSGTGNQTADLLNKSNGYSYTWGAAARMSDDIQSNITTYPNPVVDILQIQSETKVLQYKIVSMQGAVLKEGKPNENSIDLSPLVSGIYFIQMTDENGQTKMQRIVKK